jgi:hypothetical protein
LLQMVNRALKNLEHAGLIKVKFCHVIVLSFEGLINFTCTARV